MRKWILCASVALGCMGVASGSAQAQSVPFGASESSGQIAFRQLMDCMYNQAQGSPGKPGPLPKAASCVSFNGSTFEGMILYAPIGSGNGKIVLRTNDKASIGMPMNTVAYTHSPYELNNISDYDGIQFVGTGGDVVNPADIAAWNAAGNPAKFGNIIQIPAFVAPIALGFNGKDGTGATLNILPAIPTGGSSGLNLSRKAMCGIVSGHITQWNNPILTALNGGVLGTGNIIFVHRQDGSGDTFLLSNALAEQCRFEIGPMSETNSTIVSYAFPWTDHAGACPLPKASGANQNNWPDQFPTDQCGTAVANPGGGHFANASGSDNLVALVASTNGAMGYASADFWLPVKVGGLPTANLQSQWDITTSTGLFQPPTRQGAQTAMASAVPVFANATIRANPLAWSLRGVVPNPVLPSAYPIAGFNWIDMYQCYQVHNNGNNPLVWLTTWLNYLYGSTNAYDILHDNGLAEVPGLWVREIFNLLNDDNYGPRYTSDPAAFNCAGKTGAY